MGLRNTIKGKRVYFDANIFISLMEGFPALARSLSDIRDSIFHGQARIFTSELTLCEVLVPAFRADNTQLLMQYRRFLEESGAFELIPTTRDIYIRASLLRAQLGLKTPDAIHVSSAVTSECQVFLTHDTKLKTPKGMIVTHL